MAEQRGKIARRYAYWEAAMIIRSAVHAGCEFRLYSDETVTPEEDEARQDAYNAVCIVMEEIEKQLLRKTGDEPPTSSQVIAAFKNAD